MFHLLKLRPVLFPLCFIHPFMHSRIHPFIHLFIYLYFDIAQGHHTLNTILIVFGYCSFSLSPSSTHCFHIFQSHSHFNFAIRLIFFFSLIKFFPLGIFEFMGTFTKWTEWATEEKHKASLDLRPYKNALVWRACVRVNEIHWLDRK